MKRRPIWRTVLIAALAVMLLAALVTGGYAAVRRWTMPEPTYYTPNETGGSVEIHDTAVYHEKDLESEDPFSETDTAENRKPSDEELIRDAVALFRALGMEDAKSEEMTVVAITKIRADFAPRRRLRAKVITLLGFPLGSKPSSGSIIRQMPVKLSSNVSSDTV